MVKSNFRCLSKQHYQDAIQFTFRYRYETEMLSEVWNYRVTKLSYKTELCKMTSLFELLTRKFL